MESLESERQTAHTLRRLEGFTGTGSGSSSSTTPLCFSRTAIWLLVLRRNRSDQRCMIMSYSSPWSCQPRRPPTRSDRLEESMVRWWCGSLPKVPAAKAFGCQMHHGALLIRICTPLESPLDGIHCAILDQSTQMWIDSPPRATMVKCSGSVTRHSQKQSRTRPSVTRLA